ncbi:MAG: hypothetical protein ACFFFG_13525 [Candidatus Thorarchaeota archaeon]
MKSGILVRRRTPYSRVKIASISRGEVIQEQEGRWRLLTPDDRFLFRVWIMGFITDKIVDDDRISLSVDDGSGVVRVIGLDEKFNEFQRWDRIEVLGAISVSPTEDGVDVTVTPDIVTRITDDNWFLVHRLKILENRKVTRVDTVRSAVVGGIELTGVVSIEDLKAKLKQAVKRLDAGSGVRYDQLVAEFPKIDEEQISAALTELLDSGEFFEPNPSVYSYIE